MNESVSQTTPTYGPERALRRTLEAQPTSDGDGVKISRIGGRALAPLLDPFLMIDEIRSDDAADYLGGFPEHPHRGFETITFMKAGRMRHRDHMGNEGVIGAGDVQWMTAGRGVLHSEMPEQESGLLHGFQLWLNLPAAEKMGPAAYSELKAPQLPRWTDGQGSEATLIAGQMAINGQALTGPVTARSTDPLMLDLTLHSESQVSLGFSPEHQALVYVYEGAAGELGAGQLGVFSSGQLLQLKAGADGAGMLVLAGKALAEPIVQHGPFVMNSVAEIEQAVSDFRNGRLVSEH